MKENYNYPIDYSWSTDEISSVLSFFNQVEQAYEGGAQADQVLLAYRRFKEIVPSKGEEKRLDKAFQAASGYSTYQVVKLAREQGKGRIHLGK